MPVYPGEVILLGQKPIGKAKDGQSFGLGIRFRLFSSLGQFSSFFYWILLLPSGSTKEVSRTRPWAWRILMIREPAVNAEIEGLWLTSRFSSPFFPNPLSWVLTFFATPLGCWLLPYVAHMMSWQKSLAWLPSSCALKHPKDRGDLYVELKK